VPKKLAWWLLPLAMIVSGSAAAEMKIAVLNVEAAIAKSNEGKAALDKLQKEAEPEQTQLKALNDSITQQQDKLQKDREVMSQSETAKIQKELEDKQMDLQFRYKKWQKDLKDKQQALLESMEPKIQAAVNDIIQADGYDMIMRVNPAVFIYVNQKNDITARVAEKLNEKKAP
jgi:outer membrane protein